MNSIPSFLEDHISQIPALQVLQKLGYGYLTPQEALELRGGKAGNVILENVLEDQLQKINDIEFKGKHYNFSNSNVTRAIEAIKNVPYDGLIRTNEQIYDLLCLGKSLPETIAGESKSFTLKYIDWENIHKNVFHATAEFSVERTGIIETRRPDIVLFVNGIPLAVIECKRPDIKEPVGEAVSQNIRNQGDVEIPRLFIYSQLLVALSPNEVKYATTGTPAKFWSIWKELKDIDEQVSMIANQPLTDDQKNKLFSDMFEYAKGYFEKLEAEGPRLIKEQDRALYCLCKPERLLELAYKYIVFDAGQKKIARYQQYFAVTNTIRRITNVESAQRQRIGGAIWHTQGSGKSITMVMLAKAIALEKSIEDPRIVIVTDRINLDKQIWDTFHHCGKEPVKAKTGRHLIKLVRQKKSSVITTVIFKFESALKRSNVCDESNNIFILVDESHRSQYGIAHAKMRKVFPNACYIGFTGTPLMKQEKSTVAKFGGFIEPRYTIDQAVEDKTVLPLLYEGRHAIQDVDKKSIDSWFERVCEGLSEAQKADLKRKFTTSGQLNKAEQKVKRIAYDISDHFKRNWQETGFKAQLAAPDRATAVKYKEFLDEFGMVTSEVLISAPDSREDNEEVNEKPTEIVKVFWKKMMDRFQDEENYNRTLIDAFKSGDEPEIIIVVGKLLVGFDAPKNTVLYITKPFKDHGLLQAIARVNRLYEGKEYGYVIDYYGILGDLNEALVEYRALCEFDAEDLQGTITSINEEVKTLKQKHSDLWDVFKTISNRMDEEEYEELLGDDEVREKFYDRLSKFARTLKIALSTVKFLEETSEDSVKRFKRDLGFFMKLRASVKRRYADGIDYKEYEPKVQKLLDTYVISNEIVQVTPLVNIFDKDKFEAEVSKIGSTKARADTIAYRTKKTITEKMDEDPAFYRKFSKLLEEAIEDFKHQRISDAEYLQRVTEIMHHVRNRTGDEVPEKLAGREVAKAFYGLAYEVLRKFEKDGFEAKDLSADIALQIDKIIDDSLVVDWVNNRDVQNVILNEIEEYLYSIKDRYDVNLSYDDIDLIMESSLNVARRRCAQ